MKLNLITLATIKTQLGIAVSDYDAALTAMIPVVSSDIRRILNTSYDKYVSVSFDSSSTDLIVSTDAWIYYVDSKPPFDLGQVVYNPNIPDDTYLESYNPDTGKYSLSNTPTGSDDYIYPTVTINQWPAISKMVWFRYSQQSTASVNAEKLSGLRYGSVSKTYADSEINKKYNYPQILIDDLGTPYARVG